MKKIKFKEDEIGETVSEEMGKELIKTKRKKSNSIGEESYINNPKKLEGSYQRQYSEVIRRERMKFKKTELEKDSQ